MNRRCVERVLACILRDIDQAGRCTALGRLQFANDPMRRDAAEQCLHRVQNAVRSMARLDGQAYGALAGSLVSIGLPTPASSVDRMNSDVLFSIVQLCRVRLFPLARGLARNEMS